jgi:hypothetical protein
LLIGDAPPHKEKCGERLEHHNHVLTTDYMLECERFSDAGIPVHTFWIDTGQTSVECKKTFGEIAAKTGGACCELSADTLIHHVCENALEDIGGHELVAEYRRRYNMGS